MSMHINIDLDIGLKTDTEMLIDKDTDINCMATDMDTS